jgi:hypothetical protein
VTGCKKLDGVIEVKMDQNTAMLTLRFDPAVTSRQRLQTEVEKIVASIH